MRRGGREAGAGRAPSPIVRFEGIFLWPALIPDGVGLMFNDAGIIRADARSEQHPDDVIPPDTPVAATL